MRPLLSIFFLLNGLNALAQDFAQRALFLEQSMFQASNDSLKRSLRVEYIDFLVAHDPIERACDVATEALHLESPEEDLYILLKCALLAPYESSRYRAIEVSLLNRKTADLTTETLLYASMYHLHLREVQKANRYVNELEKRKKLAPGFISDSLSIRKKSVKKAKRLNQILPGLGVMYAGNLKMGIANTLFMASGIYFAQHHIRRANYFTGVFTGLAFTGRMYLGSANFAAQSAREFNHAQLDEYVHQKIAALYKVYLGA